MKATGNTVKNVLAGRQISLLIVLLLLLWGSLALFSCKKEAPFEYAVIQTGEVTDVDSLGAVFNARVSEKGSLPVLRYGFVWSTYNEPVINKAEMYVLEGEPSVGNFSVKVTAPFIKDAVYFVRAFVQNEKYVTYGKEVSFKSMGFAGPVIDGFSPERGNIKDTLCILGSNFSAVLKNNLVRVGANNAKVIYAVQDSLKVIVPGNLNVPQAKVSVTVFDKVTVSEESFELIAPVIDGSDDITGSFGEQVRIAGRNFEANPGSLKVYLGGYTAGVVEVTDTYAMVTVPDSLDTRKCRVEVVMNNLRDTSEWFFNLEEQFVNSFSPVSALTGERVTLSGSNFSPVKEHNMVFVDGLRAEVINASAKEIEIEVPLQDKGIYPDRHANIHVDVLGNLKTFGGTLFIEDPWFRLADYPGSKSYAEYFVSNNRIYAGLSLTKEFWMYTPETGQWTRMKDFPGIERDGGAGFCLNDKIYFGLGSRYNSEQFSDFWCYSIPTNSWVRLNDLSFDKRTGATGYGVGGYGYISGGVKESGTSYVHPYEDTWQYDPGSDTWEEKPSFGELEWGAVDGFVGAGAVVVDDIVYYGLGWNYIYTPSGSQERVFTFEPTKNYRWLQILSFPVKRTGRPISFVYQNAPYFSTNNVIYGYSGGTWNVLEHRILHDITGGIGAGINGKVYIGLGEINAMWEYDPSL